MGHLQIARSASKDADGTIGAASRGKWQPPGVVPPAPRTARLAGRGGTKPRAPGPRSRRSPRDCPAAREYQAPRDDDAPREDQAPRDAAFPMIATLLIGLVAEVALPWAVIWLSDALVFDVPAWSLWLIFGTSPVLTFLAVLIQLVMRRWQRWPSLRRGPEIQMPRHA